MSLFRGVSPKKIEQLIDWLAREHPMIESLEIKPLFGAGVSIRMNNAKTSLRGPAHAPQAAEKPRPQLPRQSDVQAQASSSQIRAKSEASYVNMRYPWSPYGFRMSGEVTLVIGKHSVGCVLEPIVAPRSGKFYLGKTYDETGKKKRGLRSGDFVVTGNRLGMIVYTLGWRPHKILIAAQKTGHLDIPQGIDWASVKEGDTLMLIAVEKTGRSPNP